MDYKFVADLLSEVETPKDGITSRAMFTDDNTRAILFGFDAGQELSEHTASMPAIIHLLRGEATLAFNGETHEAGPGAWAHMPAHMPHSIIAKTPVVMLLTMLKSAKGK